MRTGYKLRFFGAAIAFAAALLLQIPAMGADYVGPIFESAETEDFVRDESAKQDIWTSDWSMVPDSAKNELYYEFKNHPRYGNLKFHRLQGRKALVGRNCTVNKLIHTVSVGNWTDNMGALTNESLDDYAEFNSVATVGVTVDPLVAIRDMKNYYAKGTQAGYCIVAGSGNAVLTLDVIKALSIGFYRDGKQISTIAVEEGGTGEGVSLKLIQIPGSDEACIMLTAKSDCLFDEITLDRAGGVQVGVGDLLKIKYAFVGDATEYKITPLGINLYNTTVGTDPDAGKISLRKVQGWNPVLLGIPFPLLDNELKKLTDDDPKPEAPTYSNYAALTPIISVGYQGGVKFMMNNDDHPDREAFSEGYEVGFKYKLGSALALDAGAWIQLILFDKDGNKVQEETVQSQVLGLSVAKGGDGSASVTSKVPFSGAEIRFHTVIGINLGAMGVHYAFVKAKPATSHQCDINPTINTNLCEEITSYQLQSNPAINVTWSRVDSLCVSATPGTPLPEVTEAGYVTNLSKGRYTFRARSTSCAEGCYADVVLSPGYTQGESANACSEPLLNGMDKGVYALSDTIYGTSGGLISISNLENPENVLSTDMDAYATFVGGLKLASNLRIVGVKRTDGLMYDADFGRHTDDEGVEETDEEYLARISPKKIGFVVASDKTGINLSLLQFLQIRCYHNGQEVYRHVIEESNGVSASIGGHDSGKKVRYSITVPDIDDNGAPMQVDEIMLWTSGVLDLEGSSLDIYYAFVEEASSKCGDALGCEYIMLNYEETGTVINADGTQYGNAVNVASFTNDLGNMVDPDPDFETAMVLDNTISLGDGTVIAIKLGRTLDYRYQLGIVTDNKTFLAGVSAGSWMKVHTYYNGEYTGESITDWNVIGANVAGYGDRNFIFVQPTKRYDEIRLEIANVANVLDAQRYYGLFVRGDVDNDGVPDCQDPGCCDVTPPEITASHVCAGDPVVITPVKSLPDQTYTFVSSDPDCTSPKQSVTTDKDGKFSKPVEFDTKKPGRFQLTILDGSGKPLTNAEYVVHPKTTRWKSDNASDDWNKWDNWSAGVPWCCSDVYIPSDAKTYPRLQNAPDTTLYCCSGIIFEPRAAVQNIPSLDYSAAWADVELTPNRYHMLSAPFKNMYTGDWFVPASMQGRHQGFDFKKLTETIDGVSYAENRFNPSVYQRLWLEKAPGVMAIGSGVSKYDVTVDASHWSHEFNAVAYPYKTGEGFSVWVDNGSLPADTKFLFRIPKAFGTYHYYSDYDGAEIGKEETPRDNATDNKFIYESTDNPRLKNGLTVTLNVSDVESGEKVSDTFVFGNPFMSRIDVVKLMEENPDITLVRIPRESGEKNAKRVGAEITPDAEGLTIDPTEAVFIETASPVNSLDITLTAEAIGGEKYEVPAESARGKVAARKGNRTESLRTVGAEYIKVIADNGKSSSEVLMIDDNRFASEALFDSEAPSDIKLFAAVDGRAYDIAATADEMPFGISMAEDSAPLRISFVTGNFFPRDEYELYDRETETAYPLDHDVEIANAASGVSRFVLRKSGVKTGVEEAVAESATDIRMEIYGNEVTFSSETDCILGVEAINIQGQTAATRKYGIPVSQSTLTLPTGLYAITVSLTEGVAQTRKVIIR